MQYWELVTLSFRMAWRHKYLWLLAFFSGEAGGGFSYGNSISSPPPSNSSPDLNGAANQVASWVGSHAGLLVLTGALSLVLVVVFFLLAAVCEGALVRAAAEHDAERPFGLRAAWASGRETMGTIVVFRLILLVLWLPVAIVLIGLVAGAVFEFYASQIGTGVALVAGFVLLAILSIPYALYLYVLDRMGSRAAVLERLRAMAALKRGHGLIRHRLGRVALVWLISVAVGIVVGICFACVFGLLFLPIGIATAVGSGAPGFVLAALIVVLISLPVQGFVGAQSSTYWTLAFRRLELDPAPYAYAYAPPPIAPTLPHA